MTTTFAWAVIGAGPAGIAAVGNLLDLGAEEILWLDPAFKVGDFGTLWREVSSNTRVGLFLKFFEQCQSFHFNASPDFDIKTMDPQSNCLLKWAAEPLQWITEQLKNAVHIIQGKVEKLTLHEGYWYLSVREHSLRSKNVILATGSEPTSLSFPDIEEISLPIALHPEKLASACQKNDTVAVFGSSHSAMLILKTLIETCQVKKVINFYLSPLRYAIYLEDEILFDDTGLKGEAARWAKAHIDGKLPENLERLIGNAENISLHLPRCTKAIYATGFKKRSIPVDGIHTMEYNDRTGIIAPGLFGLGIAFPEAKLDRSGVLEYRVGLWKFMAYVKKVLPLWMKSEL